MPITRIAVDIWWDCYHKIVMSQKRKLWCWNSNRSGFYWRKGNTAAEKIHTQVSKFLTLTPCLSNTVRYRYNATNFLQNPHQRHSIARPFRARYGVSSVVSNSVLYSASFSSMMCTILSYVGPRCNGTPLYSAVGNNRYMEIREPLIELC